MLKHHSLPPSPCQIVITAATARLDPTAPVESAFGPWFDSARSTPSSYRPSSPESNRAVNQNCDPPSIFFLQASATAPTRQTAVCGVGALRRRHHLVPALAHPPPSNGKFPDRCRGFLISHHPGENVTHSIQALTVECEFPNQDELFSRRREGGSRRPLQSNTRLGGVQISFPPQRGSPASTTTDIVATRSKPQTWKSGAVSRRLPRTAKLAR